MEQFIKDNVSWDDLFAGIFYHCKDKITGDIESGCNSSVIHFYMGKYEDLEVDTNYCDITDKHIDICFTEKSAIHIHNFYKKKTVLDEDEKEEENSTTNPVRKYFIRYDRENKKFIDFIEKEIN